MLNIIDDLQRIQLYLFTDNSKIIMNLKVIQQIEIETLKCNFSIIFKI